MSFVIMAEKNFKDPLKSTEKISVIWKSTVFTLNIQTDMSGTTVAIKIKVCAMFAMIYETFMKTVAACQICKFKA